MHPRDRLYRGEIPCTQCSQTGRNGNFHTELYRREDGSFEAICFTHKREREGATGKRSYEGLAMTEQCFHIPWREVAQLTLHRPDPNSYDRKGPVVSVTMRSIQNKELMREYAIEVLHGLQLMADRRATIHQWTEGTEQNDCWTDTNYFWEEPVIGTIQDKYWGEDRINKFHKLCRVMAEIHEWVLVDETMPLLDRIALALDNQETE